MYCGRILKVLVACEFSGVVREAFRKMEHDAWSCDIIPSEDNSPYHIQGNVLEQLDNNWDLMIAHPPCTYLCVTGNKWFYHPDDKDLPTEQRRPHPKFPNRHQDKQNAIEFFIKLAQANIPQICVENPVGIISTLWRKPDQIIQPFQFGHKEPKKTCLWLKNLSKLKPTKTVKPEYIISKSGKRLPKWYYTPSQSDNRTKDRERTFTGIAEAMANQWGGN